MNNNSLKDKIYNIVSPVILKNNMLFLAPADVFFLQFRNGEYAHYDIVLKYAYVQNYFDKSDADSIKLYKKMRAARPGKHSADEAAEIFDSLIESVTKNGYRTENHTTVNRYFYVLDAAHRNAVAMYMGVPEIKVLYVDADYPVDYCEKWFVDNGFTETEMSYIKDKYRHMYERYNSAVSMVVLCDSQQQLDAITDVIGSYCEVNSVDIIKSEADFIKKCCKVTGSRTKSGNKITAVLSVRQHNVEYTLKDNNNPLPFIKYKTPVFKIKDKIISDIEKTVPGSNSICIPDNFYQNKELDKILKSED